MPNENNSEGGARKEPLYKVIDLSGGPDAERYPVSDLEDVPGGGWSDLYKGDRLVLRRIKAGTFTMGSSEDELGRLKEEWEETDDETLRRVTLTQDFYIGVFQVTQRQWKLVMGKNPSEREGEFHPVENVSYEDIRGDFLGAGWPEDNWVDDFSFLGRLKGKIDFPLVFDLPTEAQWEYACRAGTGTALNNGKNLTGRGICANLAEVGCYGGNSSGHVVVGSYRPNAWGLYDMHGNVWESCLDWYGRNLGTRDARDPKGCSRKTVTVIRGGSYGISAQGCRSASRCYCMPSSRDCDLGLRLSALSAAQ